MVYAFNDDKSKIDLLEYVRSLLSRPFYHWTCDASENYPTIQTIEYYGDSSQYHEPDDIKTASNFNSATIAPYATEHFGMWVTSNNAATSEAGFEKIYQSVGIVKMESESRGVFTDDLSVTLVGVGGIKKSAFGYYLVFDVTNNTASSISVGQETDYRFIVDTVYVVL